MMFIDYTVLIELLTKVDSHYVKTEHQNLSTSVKEEWRTETQEKSGVVKE